MSGFQIAHLPIILLYNLLLYPIWRHEWIWLQAPNTVKSKRHNVLCWGMSTAGTNSRCYWCISPLYTDKPRSAVHILRFSRQIRIPNDNFHRKKTISLQLAQSNSTPSRTFRCDGSTGRWHRQPNNNFEQWSSAMRSDTQIALLVWLASNKWRLLLHPPVHEAPDIRLTFLGVE